jgi:hypothetical protein
MIDDSQLKIGAPDKNTYPNIELNFYYSREQRLENMPDRIKSIYTPPSGKGGHFRSLTDTGPKLMLCITIAVLCVIIAVLTYVR